MKRLLLVSVFGAALICGVSYAATPKQNAPPQPVPPSPPRPKHDWHELEGIDKHLKQVINETNHAHLETRGDTGGHGAKAGELLKQAEHELRQATESSAKADQEKHNGG